MELFSYFLNIDLENVGYSVIFSMSGNTIEEQQNQYKGLNIAQFIQKPLKPSEFIKLIKKYIR
jgi:hypothetical protein